MLLLDDKISIHERLGLKLSEWLAIPPIYSLRPIDYGEMMVYSLWGIIMLSMLLLTTRSDQTAVTRQLSQGLVLSILGLAFFGGFIDMLHIVAEQSVGLSTNMDSVFGAIEDGGEMVAVSFALWLTYYACLQISKEKYARDRLPKILTTKIR